MKKTIIISILALTATVNAQIKIFPGGSVTYGTTSTNISVKHHFVGNFLAVSSASNVGTNSAALIKGNNGYSTITTPDYTWIGNEQTGIFHPASNVIGITLAGGEKFRFSGGQLLSSATQATATPAYSWNSDANTGIYNPAADVLGFVTNGGEKFRINSTGQLLSNNNVSTATAPDYTWIGSTTTGIFHGASNFIGFTVNGTEIYRAILNGQILSAKVTPSASTPDYSWNNDAGTGLYLPGTSTLGFSTGGAEKFRMNSVGQLLSSATQATATPAYSWTNDANTGIYNPAADVIGFTVGGAEAMRIYSNKKVFIGTQPNTGAPYQDGQLTIANTTVNDRALVINHTANADWQNAISTTLSHSLSTTYGVTYNNTGTFYVAGAGWIYSQGNYLGSDINIKDDIHAIDSASSKLNRLNGVIYKLKKEKQSPALYGGTAQEYMGVIAQDVEKVAPQAVKTVHDGTKAVAYEMLIGLLIEGFKEQSAKVTKLESDLNSCCTKNGGVKTTQRTINSNTSDDANVINEAQSFIKQNKPNPFSNETIIEYNIVSKSNTASIMIFDMNGKLLKTFPVKEQGKGQLTINGKELSAGLYHYSLVVDGQEIDTKKMIITE